MGLITFGKLFKHVFLFLILAELLSLLAYLLPILGPAAFFVVLAAALILTLIKLEYGLYFLLAELFVGGKGYLFALDIGGVALSIRMGLFLVIISVWMFKGIRNYELGIMNTKKSLLSYFPTFLIPYSLLAITITYGLINGLINNQPSNVFFDFNAWIFFALIFVFWDVVKNAKIAEDVLRVLIAASAWLALKTIGTLLLFSHHIAGIGGIFYKWIRDSGVGEITYVSGTIFRVFFQSQLYCLIAALVILAILISQKISRGKNYISLAVCFYLTGLAIIISQSRSFWVGAMAGLFSLLIFAWWKLNFRIKKTALLIIILIAVLASQIFLIQLATLNFSGNLVKDRFSNLQAESAGISRLNQLRPLAENIFQQLLFGYGFGKTLTYVSNDPRILKNNPSGIYTTYAFEWGYLDIMLKIGLVGLLIYLLLIGWIFWQGNKKTRKSRCPLYGIGIPTSSIQLHSGRTSGQENKTIYIGLLVGLIALCATNVFSPYLNHPLGIGYIMIVSVIINSDKLMLK